MAVAGLILNYLPQLRELQRTDKGLVGQVLTYLASVPAWAWWLAIVLAGLAWAWEYAKAGEVAKAELRAQAAILMAEMLREWDRNETELRDLHGLEQIRYRDDVVLPRYRTFGDRIVTIHDAFAARGAVNKDWEKLKRERWTNGAWHRQIIDYISTLLLERLPLGRHP